MATGHPSVLSVGNLRAVNVSPNPSVLINLHEIVVQRIVQLGKRFRDRYVCKSNNAVTASRMDAGLHKGADKSLRTINFLISNFKKNAFNHNNRIVVIIKMYVKYMQNNIGSV